VAAIDWPAWVQAGSAVVIAGLTVALVIATSRYVRASRTMADEMRRTNEMAERQTVRALRKQAARLHVKAGGWDAPNDEHGWRFQYAVENAGEGTAHDVVLSFDDREVQADQSIAHGSLELVTLSYSIDESDPTDQPEHPPVQSVVFRDADGSWWIQSMRRGRLFPPEPWTEGMPFP
jgi:hypothetical protein